MADVKAHVTGTVWKVEVTVGQQFAEGDVLVILESMKMEMPIEAEGDGAVSEILVKPGDSVKEGQTVLRYS